jgi:hypothetical protein
MHLLSAFVKLSFVTAAYAAHPGSNLGFNAAFRAKYREAMAAEAALEVCPRFSKETLQFPLNSVTDDEMCLPSFQHGSSMPRIPPISKNATFTPWKEVETCSRTFDDGVGPFCVYTAPNFARGRGISVFTTPAEAQRIAKTAKSVLTNSTSLDATKARSVIPAPYIAQAIPGRGIGLVANTTLQRGDSVFSHTPALIVDEATFKAKVVKECIPLQREAVERLPRGTREAFMDLHGHFGGEKVDDIVQTNSFRVNFGEGGKPHRIVMPETSVSGDSGSSERSNLIKIASQPRLPT